MPSDFSFRLSTYLSLALACACLGYAEYDLLPSGAVIAGLVLALLVVAFRLEGRFELGLEAANRLGVVLFVGAAVWLVTQFANRDSLINTVPWPASLLPYIGTMLLVAMPAKLLRPKHAGDWWALQGMGMVAVALGCALAEDGVFGLLLTLYAVTAVGGLALFYLKREAGQVPPAPDEPMLAGGLRWLGRGFERLTGVTMSDDRIAPAPPAVVAGVPARVRGAWRPAVGWLLVALAVALPLFFLTPRSGVARWHMSGVNLETGYDSPQMTDLNRTGELRVNREVAFEVAVIDADGRPFDDLSPAQRWRGVSFGLYEAGKWKNTAVNRLIDPGDQAVVDQVPPSPPPAVTPGMLVADFVPQARTSEPPVAEPVRWRAGAGVPIWSAGRGGLAPGIAWMQKTDAAFNVRSASPGFADLYRQFVYPPADGDPDLGTGFGFYLPSGPDPAGVLRALPGGLTELPVRTRELLDRLVAVGALPARVTASPRFRQDGRPDPADWEAVARAFAVHLSNGGYEYTLTLTRKDKRSDPIEDFLYRTKAGNCERFAAGLVLMCRAVGVPSRYVLGFKGHEPLGDGRYQVRQDHAHAWAEVLVPRGTGAKQRWHWLSLDPTPDGGTDAAPDDILSTAAKSGKSFFSEFIVGYNADRRREAAEGVKTFMSGPAFLAGLGGLLGTVGVAAAVYRLVRSLRRRARRPAAAVAWYGRLVEVLTRAGHPPAAGATPAEYARAVGEKLPANVAGVPGELTALFYAERFGSRPPTAEEAARIEAGLKQLARLPAVGSCA